MYENKYIFYCTGIDEAIGIPNVAVANSLSTIDGTQYGSLNQFVSQLEIVVSLFLYQFLCNKKYIYFHTRFSRLCFTASNNNCHNIPLSTADIIVNVLLVLVSLNVETLIWNWQSYRVVGVGNLALESLDELGWFQSYSKHKTSKKYNRKMNGKTLSIIQ